MEKFPLYPKPFIVFITQENKSRRGSKKNDPVSLPIAIHPFLKKLTILLEKQYRDSNFHVCELSKLLCLCPMQVHRKVKKHTGLPPGKYLLLFRIQKAKGLLQTSDLSISEIAEQTGFTSPHHFSRAFRRFFGCCPKEMREQILTML